MSNANIISFAKNIVNQKLYGTLDYYVEHTKTRNEVILTLCDHLASADANLAKAVTAKQQEIDALKKELEETKAQNVRLVDRIINGRPTEKSQ